MKKLLLVIDYQNDFVSGSLGFEQAVSLEDPICRKIESYLKNGDDIIFTLDTHGQDYSSTQEGKKLPVVHCVQGTHGGEKAAGSPLSERKRWLEGLRQGCLLSFQGRGSI